MRDGIDAEWIAALEARGIRTAILGWFDFLSEPVAVWTGWAELTPLGTGDALLDGVTFHPMQEGVPVAIGDNGFSYSGSDELQISLTVGNMATDELQAASLDPDEYQGRTAIIWRALMTTLPTAATPAEWQFRRVRAGAMDSLSIVNDGQAHLFTLSIEAHASMVTNASGSTYLDQPKFDATDTSQDYAVSIANNAQAPTRISVSNNNSGTSNRYSIGSPNTLQI